MDTQTIQCRSSRWKNLRQRNTRHEIRWNTIFGGDQVFEGRRGAIETYHTYHVCARWGAEFWVVVVGVVIGLFFVDEEIGGVEGMRKFVHTDEFRRLNVGFALDEGIASPNEEYALNYGERCIWRKFVLVFKTLKKWEKAIFVFFKSFF